MAIFPGQTGLAATRMYLFWTLIIGAKDDGDGGDNWSYKMCKAPVKLSSPTNQHPAFYRPDALLSLNCVRSLKENSARLPVLYTDFQHQALPYQPQASSQAWKQC